MSDAPVQGARPLLGRESQLAAAAARMADADASRGALLLLSGEPGIGKTRVAEEIVGVGETPSEELGERHPGTDLQRSLGDPLDRLMFTYHSQAFDGSAA
jgi:hypothetical protein